MDHTPLGNGPRSSIVSLKISIENVSVSEIPCISRVLPKAQVLGRSGLSFALSAAPL
jgi:hypothetical protein